MLALRSARLAQEAEGAGGRLVDFAHCRWLPWRDKAYRTVIPSSATKTMGASTDKISHHTSMRPPWLAARNYETKSGHVPPTSLSQGALSAALSTSLAAWRYSQQCT